ncbi:TY-Chap domain-containing protein [Streptomyces sp. NPDC050418]|uniref:TY-Chap domain-containing protein n=1 Tax=Streptomyces sp. NPDC050418 TaxID=3365612 RepID=UPI0037AD096D
MSGVAVTEWGALGEALAEELASLSDGSVLVIREAGRTGRYVQFLQSDATLEAELSGDHHLDPALRAGVAGSRLIVEAGWRPPVDTAYGHNWWAELAWPSPSAAYRNLAAMSVSGLRDGLRIAGPQALVYEAWDGRQGNRSLTCHRLGLTPQT